MAKKQSSPNPNQSPNPNPDDETLNDQLNDQANDQDQTPDDETEDDEDEGAGGTELKENEQGEQFDWPELVIENEGFKLPKKGDPKVFHVILQKGGFDPETGKPLHKPFPSTHNVADFRQFLGNAKGLGYKKVIIKHIPQGYEKFQTEWKTRKTGTPKPSY
jgi:hypothetical protein